MVFAYHEIYFNITQPGSFINNFRPFFNWYTILNDIPVIPPGTSLSPAFSMFHVFIDLLIPFINRFITVLTLPYPLINPLSTYWAFSGFVSNGTYDFRAPLVLRQSLDSLIFHISIKLNNFWLAEVPVIGFALCISRQVSPSGLSTLCNVSAQFPANGRGINPNFPGYYLLLHSCLNKGLNLIPLYQTG